MSRITMLVVTLMIGMMSTPAASDSDSEGARIALERGIHYFQSISTDGGYLWKSSPDLSQRWGESPASSTQSWVQPPGTPTVGGAFLAAYDATGDPKYLDAAKAAAHALTRGQMESGGWEYLIDSDAAWRESVYLREAAGQLTPVQSASRRNVSTFDDDNTQSALRFLMAVVARTRGPLDERDVAIRESLDYGLEGMIRAQYPNGAWPQAFDGQPLTDGSVRISQGNTSSAQVLSPIDIPVEHPLVKAKVPDDWPRTWPGVYYRAYYTFNDRTISDCILTMLVAWKQFGDERYLESARRGGDFILRAQLPEPHPIWAQQYNFDMEPAWARNFEFPAAASWESLEVMNTLVELFHVTGDERYLGALVPAIDWFRRSEVKPGVWSRYYELGTNRPIYTDAQRQITYEDDNLLPGYAWQGPFGVVTKLEQFEEVLGQRSSSAQQATGAEKSEYVTQWTDASEQQLLPTPELTRDQKRARLQALHPRVSDIIAAQDEKGRWITDDLIQSSTFSVNVNILSEYLALAYELSAPEVTPVLLKIDEGVSWTPPFWGYNAPKLVYDGAYYYSIGHWGESREKTHGVIYRLDESSGQWIRGYEWDDLNYQPGMLLLDSQKRLVLVYPQMRDKFVVKRSLSPGDFKNFESLAVPDSIETAGYLSAGIEGDRIVFGFIGPPDVYSFNVAMLDMETMQWTGPTMLSKSQRETEPFTTWRYPIIQPVQDGFHMALSNGRDRTSYKHEILYVKLPYSISLPVQPEVVAEVTPWTERTARATDMWHGKDGTVLVTGQYQPELVENSSTLRGGLFPLATWRRDPATGEWTRWDIGETGIGGFYKSRTDGPDTIWLISSHDTTLKLNHSVNQGRSWSPVPLPSLTDHGLENAYWLHTLTEFSGSVVPENPVAVFTTGITPDYAIWFVQFKVTR